MDIGEYARTSEDAWWKLREQLKQVVRDVTDDDARLSELQEGIAALRRANADRLSALQGMCDATSEEKERATSLTLNDTDDEVILDKEISVVHGETEEQAATTSVDEAHEEQRRPVSLVPNDVDDGVVLDEARPAVQNEPDRQDSSASAEYVAPSTSTEEGTTEKSSRPKTKGSKSSRAKDDPAVEQPSLLEEMREEGRHDE